MNLSEEDLKEIRKILNREPTMVEKHIFDTMWSEHCSYKSSKDILKKYLPARGSEVALGIGEDSGIVKFTRHNGKQYCIAVSHESHNHPSQILPVEGAATGVGGVVRDVYCMGADVIGVLNSLHFGIDNDGKNPLVEEISEEVVQGVSDYANPLGVPVLGGETLFHKSYNDNCLVNVAALGLVEEDRIIRSFVPEEAKNEPYVAVLFGKSTDATGFGGASFASTTLDNEDEVSNIGAVQVHDPFLKRVIVEAVKYLLDVVKQENIKIGFKDLGAGGIACVTSELAAAGCFGMTVDLDKVNKIFDDLPPEIIACSETQERFCVVVPATFAQTVLDIFNEKFELPHLYHNSGAVVIGDVVSEPVYKLIYKGEVVCDLPVTTITTEVKADRKANSRQIERKEGIIPKIPWKELGDICCKILSSANICSKRYVYRFFDNAVRGDTVVYPGESDAVVVSPVQGCVTGLTVSMDSNLYGGLDPYVSGAYAVAESVRNIIASGGRPLALTDCLNYGNPEKPDVFFDFEEGVKGIADAANSLSFIPGEAIPVISGNVSFYNESKQGNAIVPSPVVVAVGRIDDYHNALTMQLRDPGEILILTGKRYSEFGASQVKEYIKNLNDVAPQVRFDEEAKQNKAVYECIKNNWITACHDISAGGFWTAVSEMVLGERGCYKAGVEIDFPKDQDPVSFLFSENGGYLISVKTENLSNVIENLESNAVDFYKAGTTNETDEICIKQDGTLLLNLKLKDLESNWNIRNA